MLHEHCSSLNEFDIISFNQGAMVYVVVDDIIPEAQSQGNGRAASWGAVVSII